MTYQKMMNRANLYKDLQQVVQNKPKLIAEKRAIIESLEQKIMELQSGQGVQSFKQQAYGLLNPKRYLSTVSPVDMQAKVNQLLLELEAEQSLLEKLETIFPIETVDLHAMQVQVNEIIDDKQRELDTMIETVRAAEEQFKSTLRAYNEACEDAKTFERVVRDTIHRWEGERNRNLYGKALLKVSDEEVPRNNIGKLTSMPYRVEMVNPTFRPTTVIKRDVISDELRGLLKQQGIYHL